MSRAPVGSPTGAAVSALQPVVDDVVARAGFVLDELDVRPAGRRLVVRVTVEPPEVPGVDDGPAGGADLDAVAELSREVSAAVDASEAADPRGARRRCRAPTPSRSRTPGTDRPLTEPHHWQRAWLRRVAVTLAGGETLTGRVGGVSAAPRADRASVTLAVGKDELRTVALADVTPRRRRGRVQARARGRGRGAAGGAAGRAAPQRRGGAVKVDLMALRAIERDKDISFESVVSAIESALLSAYRQTGREAPGARAEVDRDSGEIRVLVPELGEDGERVGEVDDTPAGFDRIAAATARQVVVARLRDAENDRSYGEYATREGEVVAGVVQRDARANARGVVVVDIGSLEGVIPSAEQVPGEKLEHGERVRCYVIGVSRSPARHGGDALPHASQPGAQALRVRGPRDRQRRGGDHRDRPRGRVPVEDRGAVERAPA